MTPTMKQYFYIDVRIFNSIDKSLMKMIDN